MIRQLVADAIATERLALEPLEPRHAAEMLPVLAALELYAFTGGEPPTAEALLRRYEVQARGHSADGSERWLNWILRLRETDAVVGFVQATVTESAAGPSADIAWLVAPAHQGAGLAGEAAAVMVAWLSDHGIAALRACIHPDHRASARVAERLGLAPTDEIDDGEVVWVAR